MHGCRGVYNAEEIERLQIALKSLPAHIELVLPGTTTTNFLPRHANADSIAATTWKKDNRQALKPVLAMVISTI